MRLVGRASGALFCPVVACGLLGFAHAARGSGPAAKVDPPLAGSQLTVRDALDRAHLVVVATVDRVGFGGELSGMKRHYPGAAAGVRRPLKGEARGKFAFSFALGSIGRPRAEEAPEEGEDYLIFLEMPAREGGPARAIKMLRPTPEALRSVEGLLRDRPLPGSGCGVREVAEEADHVIVARIIRLERGGPAGPEGSPYHAKVELTRALKGGEVVGDFVYFPVRVAPNGEAEEVPSEGSEYAFFIRQHPGEEMVALKIAPPDRETIRIVEGSVAPE